MHVHGSARAERVRSNVIRGEIESSCPNPNGIGPEDRNDVRGDNVAEPVVGVRVVADRSGS